MTQRIIIAGTGFAGMWAALAAARAVSLAGRDGDIEITAISPVPRLHIRPRFYEQAFGEMSPDIGPLLSAVGVGHLVGTVESIDVRRQEIAYACNSGKLSICSFDKFVLAAGSRLFIPDIPGVERHCFNVDQLTSAMALDEHLRSLADKPETVARNTVVVAGGGFTGIETAAELPARLREILGEKAKVRVVIVEQAPDIGPDLGPGPRPVISEALAACGVEVIVSTGVVAVDPNGVDTSDGKRIESNTVIWTAGMRAHPLAAQIPGEHDRFGRVHADQYLHAKGVPGVFVTGDVAVAATDQIGNTTAMSCQHALSLGRVAGYNAGAELTGLPLHAYSQPKYVTCLDLGPWGAVYTEGWDRKVHLSGEKAKSLKRTINTQRIYPPEASRDAAFAVANPDFVLA